MKTSLTKEASKDSTACQRANVTHATEVTMH